MTKGLTYGLLQIIYAGELFYAAESPAGRRQWAPCRAVLISEAILLAFSCDGQAPEEERRIDLSTCGKCESIRANNENDVDKIEDPLAIAQEHGIIQAFRLVWYNGLTEIFGCLKGTQRVQWLANILDVFAMQSEPDSQAQKSLFIDSPSSKIKQQWVQQQQSVPSSFDLFQSRSMPNLVDHFDSSMSSRNRPASVQSLNSLERESLPATPHYEKSSAPGQSLHSSLLFLC